MCLCVCVCVREGVCVCVRVVVVVVVVVVGGGDCVTNNRKRTTATRTQRGRLTGVRRVGYGVAALVCRRRALHCGWLRELVEHRRGRSLLPQLEADAVGEAVASTAPATACSMHVLQYVCANVVRHGTVGGKRRASSLWITNGSGKGR